MQTIIAPKRRGCGHNVKAHGSYLVEGLKLNVSILFIYKYKAKPYTEAGFNNF